MILDKNGKRPVNPITGWPRSKVVGVSVFNSLVKIVDRRPAGYSVKHG
jgi:hypothetical protein